MYLPKQKHRTWLLVRETQSVAPSRLLKNSRFVVNQYDLFFFLGTSNFWANMTWHTTGGTEKYSAGKWRITEKKCLLTRLWLLWQRVLPNSFRRNFRHSVRFNKIENSASLDFIIWLLYSNLRVCISKKKCKFVQIYFAHKTEVKGFMNQKHWLLFCH